MEMWLPIQDYNGVYEISSFGRVKSNDMYVNARSGSIQLRKGRILTPGVDTRGYLQVVLYKGGKGNNFLVHRLVAKAFIENPELKRDVNHIDFNKHNNHVSNLEWATPSENNIHTYQNGRGNHKKSAIELLDDSFKVIHEFDSISSGLRFLGKKQSGYPITAMKDGHKCYGYYWKLKTAK